MRSLIMIALMGSAVVGTLTLGVGCKQKESVSAEESKASATAAIKAGSHEDWCEEHQVPESQCTLCDPKLIPAFKATNDWCDIHKLPKSHDRTCNPALKITRPPKS